MGNGGLAQKLRKDKQSNLSFLTVFTIFIVNIFPDL